MKARLGCLALAVSLAWGSTAAAQETQQWQAAPPPPGMAPQPAVPPQPGAWQAAPMPGQPMPAQPAAAPRSLPYQAGQPVPVGYHIETRSSWILAIVGFSQMGGMWLFSSLIGLSFAQETDSPELYSLTIPVVGPFLLFDDTRGDAEVLLDMLLVLSGGVQVIGLVIGVVGLSNTKEILVRDPGLARLEPVVGPGWAGLRGTF